MSKAIRYDALLVRAIAAELRAALVGAVVEAYRFDRQRRMASLYIAGERVLRFDLHPEHGQITLTPGRARTNATRLGAHQIAEVSAPPDERRLHIIVLSRSGEARLEWVADLTMNRWNAFLLREGEGSPAQALAPEKKEPAWIRAGGSGRIGRAGAHDDLDEARWIATLSSLPPEEFAKQVLRTVAYTSPLNIAYVLEPVTDPRHRQGLARAYARWTELVRQPPAPHLLARPWGLQPYPHPLGEPDARRVDSLLEGIRELRRASLQRLKLQGAESEIARRQEALDRRVDRLRAQLARAAEAARLQQAADVLLASLHRVTRGAERVELEDFHGGPITIPLDPELTAAQNADRMYQEARRLRRAAQRIPALLDAATRELAHLASLRERVRAGELPDRVRRWVRHRRRREKEPERPQLPYRRYRTSSGLEVRVGKTARDNDDLTLHHSSPNDIWMHARDVAGSHVVLRWSRRAPVPQRDLVEAAALAAWFSKARTSKVVAVDWAPRRYVRKPRKAPPGTVVIERAQTIFVEPSEDLEQRLRVEKDLT